VTPTVYSQIVEEELLGGLPGGPVRLVRVADLSPYVDRERLLSDPSAAEPPYWMHLWPSARVLARHVAREGTRLRGKRVLEIGCGLGLPGLVAARCGARVVLTDRSLEALGFAHESARRNGLSVATVAMDWAAPALQTRFDLCLAADVTYDPGSHATLAKLLANTLGGTGEAWIAESVRAEEQEFPRAFARHFAVSETRVAEYEEGHQTWVRLLRGRWQ
jgi:predicted nicotinamide N-methyase